MSSALSIEDHRLIGSLVHSGLVIDNAVNVIIGNLVVATPDLPLALLDEVGRDLLRMGDALLRRARGADVPPLPA